MTSARENEPPAAETSPGKGRLWLLRILTVVLIPAFFIGLLEGGLRLAGFGYPTGFFTSRTLEGEKYFFTNHRFTFQFFPQALARTMIPHRIRADKPKDTYRIFVFGESAAMGDPDPAYGFTRYLEILLEERFPGTDFEIINTAITAINSHVILPIARDCAEAGGDLWILYMGNNEIIGPYGPGTVFGTRAPPLPVVRALLALKRTRIGQLMDTLRQGLRSNSGQPETWGGINMFAENLLRENDPGRFRARANFKANLEEILEEAEAAEVPVLLSTVAVNLRDCAPFGSLHDKNLHANERADWQRLFEEAEALARAKSWQEALQRYEQAAALDPVHAETHYRIGRLHARLGNFAAARTAMIRARDTDAVPVRADSPLNEHIRERSDRQPTASPYLVDTAARLARQATGGLPGNEFFYEHVHFTVAANYRMARIFADNIIKQLPDPILARDKGEWVHAVTCQRKLAASLWDQHRIWTSVAEQLTNPPFTARSNNDAELARARARARKLRDRADHPLNRKIHERALAADAEDYHLRNRYGHFLLNNGLPAEAIPHFRWITERFPDYEGGHQDLGLALLLNKQFKEAEERFERVLQIRPHYPRARQALELIRENPESVPKLP